MSIFEIFCSTVYDREAMSKTLGVDIFIRKMSLILKICVSFAALLCWREKPVCVALCFVFPRILSSKTDFFSNYDMT